VLRRNDRTRVILNLGGMANITVLPKDRSQPILGFDCGPGNALQDRWAEHHGRGPMDADGQWAASGAVQPALLRRLMDDPYFHRSPPKSSGPEYFNLRWLRPMLSDESPADVQATLAALSVETIAAAVRESAPQAQQLLVCGGGVHNRFVMTQLDAALSDVEVVSTAAAGLDPDYVEAIAFAWLAYRTVEGLPGNEPAVTGASHAAVLGGLYQGRGRGRTEGLKG
jgi:anhydro-N-acetylmuramic acid kinase